MRLWLTAFILLAATVAGVAQARQAAPPAQGKLSPSEIQLWQTLNADAVSQSLSQSELLSHISPTCLAAKQEPLVRPSFLKLVAGTIGAIKQAVIRAWQDLDNEVTAAEGRSDAYPAGATRANYLQDLSAIELGVHVDIAGANHLIGAATALKGGDCSPTAELRTAANQLSDGNDAFHAALDALAKIPSTP